MKGQEYSVQACNAPKRRMYVRAVHKDVRVDRSMRADGTCTNGVGDSVNMAIINQHATDHLGTRHTSECECASSCVKPKDAVGCTRELMVTTPPSPYCNTRSARVRFSRHNQLTQPTTFLRWSSRRGWPHDGSHAKEFKRKDIPMHSHQVADCGTLHDRHPTVHTTRATRHEGGTSRTE